MDQNFGDYVANALPDANKFRQAPTYKVPHMKKYNPFPCEVINELICARAPSPGARPVLTLVPQTTLGEFWLPLEAFDFSKTSKCGCAGLSQNSIFVWKWIVKHTLEYCTTMDHRLIDS